MQCISVNKFYGVRAVEFWSEFYDAVREAFFSDKIYVLREIVDEPKTIREIASATGMPYVTVRKYLKWAHERGLATVVGASKGERGALSEEWLLTFVPEVVGVRVDGLVVKVRLKVRFRKVFCERVCPLRDECPHYQVIKKGDSVTPYRVIEVEKRGFTGEGLETCKALTPST